MLKKNPRFTSLVMRLIVLGITLATGIAVSIAWKSIQLPGASKVTNETQAEAGTLKRLVLDAKAKGEDHLELRIKACGWDIGDLSEALSRDTVVLADLIDKKTYQDGDGLYTLYKFRTREVLVEHPLPRSVFSSFEGPPTELRPIAENEFLIQETNGRMEIDGVTVTQYSNGAEYFEGQTYLLFLWLEPTKRIAIRSSTNPLGVFLVDPAGTLIPYLNHSYPLQDQITRRFGNSLEKFRQALRK